MKKRKKISAAGALLLTGAVLLGGCQTEKKNSAEVPKKQTEMSGTESKTGTGAEEASQVSEDAVFGTFSSRTLDGEEISQDIFAEAELTMVNIWGTFCGPCIREMPDLGEISRDYADKGVQLIGMISDVIQPLDDSEPDTGTALEIVEATEADYTHILLSEDLYRGYLGEVQVVPTTVFVDKNGEEVGVYTGSKSKEEWVSIIEEMRKQVVHEG